MIYVLHPRIAQSYSLRLFAIFGFAALTAIGAQISLPLHPVPVTLQVLAVLLAGLTLGARDGFLSQLTYLGGIAVGLPIAANYVGGLAAFNTPSTGYLISFPLAAAVVGMLAVRDQLPLRFGAALVGIAVIYLCGALWLKSYLNLSWAATWTAGVAPFIVIDLAKAILAATAGEGLHGFLRAYTPPQN